MAPELRKRKPVAEATKTNGSAKIAEKSTPKKAAPKGKRKATEDSSPVSLKKQKSVKKTAIEKKQPKSKSAKSEDEDKEDFIEIEQDEASESEEKDDENLQVLALEVDPDDEGATNEEEFQPGQDVGKVPKVSKEVQKSVKASKEEPGVVYIGRIPHGFYEHEMRQYLSQFGPISRLRLSRNKKTGASKHFAFVEFNEASTAEIVSKTMDNYLLFGHILKCKVIPKHQVHENLFKGSNTRFKKVPWNKIAGKKLERSLTESTWEVKVARERSNRAKKAAKLKEIGYDFEAPQLKAVPVPAAIENGEAQLKSIEAAPEPVETEKAVGDAGNNDASKDDSVGEALATPKKAPKTKTTKVAKAKKARA